MQWAGHVLLYPESGARPLLRNVRKRLKLKTRGLSPLASYTDRATAARRRSDCQILRLEGATWSA
jgi:hypothetical protein